uniref:25 kDa small heat shock protein n=1 Tax=Sarcophaga crassipalpis TaxID=59312 RepID=A1E385_SARCR|nr:25 kDa small heat shock protein [Sarcophaga crassipalpis]
MSLVPLLVNLARGLENDYHHHHGLDDWDRFLDDDFGFGINPVDIFRPRLTTNSSSLLQPRRSVYSPYWLSRRQRHHREKNDSTSGSTALMPTVGKDGFQVCMDVSQFKPSELTVKTVDNAVVIEGKHEEREDEHGLIQRHFVRKYTLPKDYDPKDVISTISSDGVLTVKAPPPPNKTAAINERVVQIQQTGPAHLNLKQPEQANKQQQTQANGAEKVEAAK